MSRKSNCYDNAVAESFFSSLRRERVDRRKYWTKEGAVEDIRDYIDFYNGRSRHSYLNGLCPVDFENRATRSTWTCELLALAIFHRLQPRVASQLGSRPAASSSRSVGSSPAQRPAPEPPSRGPVAAAGRGRIIPDQPDVQPAGRALGYGHDRRMLMKNGHEGGQVT
jgi:hypothetical protein